MMNFFDNVKNSVSAAAQTISGAAQSLVDKNRLNAQINRLKLVIKNETLILNKAFTAMGKYYYENPEGGSGAEVANLREIADNAKQRLKKAQEQYLALVEQKTQQAVAGSDVSDKDIDDITVACADSGERSEPIAEIIDAAEDVAQTASEALSEEDGITVSTAVEAVSDEEACITVELTKAEEADDGETDSENIF